MPHSTSGHSFEIIENGGVNLYEPPVEGSNWQEGEEAKSLTSVVCCLSGCCISSVVGLEDLEDAPKWAQVFPPRFCHVLFCKRQPSKNPPSPPIDVVTANLGTHLLKWALEVID